MVSPVSRGTTEPSVKLDYYLHFIAVHADETRNLDFLAGAGMIDESALAHAALVNTHVG